MMQACRCGWLCSWRGPVSLLLLAGISVSLSSCVQSRRPMPSFDGAALETPAQDSRVEVQVFDPGGQATMPARDVTGSAGLVGELRRSPWSARSRGVAEAQSPRAQEPAEGKQGGGDAASQDEAAFDDPFEDADLYARFGRQIVKNPDGTLTKPYYVNAETGNVLNVLLQMAAGARVGKPGKDIQGLYEFGKDPKNPTNVFDKLLAGHKVLFQQISAFDKLGTTAMAGRNWNGQMGGVSTPVVNDLVLVTTTPDGLEAFETAMELFYNSVPQILLECRVLEFSVEDTLDLGVTPVGNNPTVRTTGRGSFIQNIVSAFPNTAAGTAGSAGASEGLLTLGGIHDNLELNATLELLQTNAKSDIISNPKIAVRQGGMAIINTTSKVPYPSAQIQGTNVKTTIKFENIGVTMQIRPVVTPGDAVHLQLFVEVSAVTGFSETDPIPTPIVSTRQSRTHVIVPNGKSAVIGGLLTKSRFENEAKVPLLGDVPILGYLFRSTFVQTSYNEVIFIVTPKVLESWPSVDEDFTGVGY
jgi:type II secretory pathway component GspD/PulD (secretin)